MLWSSSTVAAAPMRFEHAGSTSNCPKCLFVLGIGEITDETPAAFRDFLGRNPDAEKRLRLSSPGGSLLGGIALGEMIRSAGYATEIGATRHNGDGSVTSGGAPGSQRTPGVCASACAYAFLGGVERTIDINSKIGFHRFYRESAIAQPTARLFTGADLDGAQRTTAAIVLYLLRMGIDARVASLAAEAAPNEIRWLSDKEAHELRITYAPDSWQPWRLEPYRGGALAVSETQDGKLKMVIGCSRRQGIFMTLTDDSRPEIRSWFEQIRTCGFDGTHPVLGRQIKPGQVVVSHSVVGATIRFRLPREPHNDATPALFVRGGPDYPNACTASAYQGTMKSFWATVVVATRACFLD
jgi:hypothetical protein